MILGIDAGTNNGVATFVDGQLVQLDTYTPLGLVDYIRHHKPQRIIYEDSRLQSHVWSRGVNSAAMQKISRNVGTVDAVCKLIVEVCAEVGCMAHGISPKDKGAKLDAKAFSRVTGWTSRSNQHERDAAMVAWHYIMAA